MSSKSIKWIRTGIVLASLLGVNTHAVHADSAQDLINRNFQSGSVQFDPKGGAHLTNAALRLEVPQSQIYLPLISAGTCTPGYEDDFSDPGSGWPIVEDADRLLEYNNGEYRILVKNTDRWGRASPGYKAIDYLISVDVRNANDVYGSYGIIFQLADDWSTYYTFEITTDGYYMIWRFNSKKSGWKLLAYDISAYINQGTASNQIQLARTGVLIKGYANGQLIVEVEDDSYTGFESVGLITTAYKGQANVDARFDNFTVDPLNCSN